MQTATFEGEIQGGRIVTKQPLADFEGKQVIITLSLPQVDAHAGAPETNSQNCSPPPYAPEEAEILEDAGRIRIPPQDVTTLKARIIDMGRLPPKVYMSDEEE